MTRRSIRNLTVALALAGASAGCGSAGGLGEILGGGQNAPPAGGSTTVNAEIEANDTARQLLQIRTDDGQQGVVRWDAGTEVVYEGETYTAAALERGDLVQMRLEQTSDGDMYAAYVRVTTSVQDRR